MKTLQELKNELQVGTKLVCVDHFRENRIGEETTILKTNTTGVYQDNGMILDFPKASLLEFTEDIFTIYSPGLRELTTEELKWKNRLENLSTDEEWTNDALTDGSSCYYKQKAFAYANNIEHLLGYNVVRGMKYDYNSKKMRDIKIKGEKLYSFRIIRKEDNSNEE